MDSLANTPARPDGCTDDAVQLTAGEDPFAPAALARLAQGYGSPLFVIDLDRVRRQYHRLAAALPGVGLHYALKPLPHAAVVATLCEQGAGFDLASNGEVDLVQRLGVTPQRCIHTHPIKRPGDIRTALDFGVTRFVVDNPDELRKFLPHRDRAELLIRVSFRSPAAVCDLSRKFGCPPEAVPELLRLAAQWRLTVSGLSFHVGSQTTGPQMHVEAIRACAGLLREALRAGHAPDMLDIGGGFPVDYREPVPPIETFCAPIRAALQELPGALRIIAEPGRYIAAPAAVLLCRVMGRALRDGRWWYYLDDGLYGSFSGWLFDHARYPIEALVAAGEMHPAVLAGPTCDSIDVIDETLVLPLLDVGDLVVGRQMGAYTWASASEFNFFPRATALAFDRGRLLRDTAPT